MTAWLLWPLIFLALLIGAGTLLAAMIFRFVQARKNGRTDGAWVSSPMTLGIAGGVLALLTAALLILNMFTGDAVFTAFCLAGLVGGIAGIVGGAVLKRQRKAAGVLMLVGAALTLITLLGPMLLICGGVLALVPAKAADKPGEDGAP